LKMKTRKERNRVENTRTSNTQEKKQTRSGERVENRNSFRNSTTLKTGDLTSCKIMACPSLTKGHAPKPGKAGKPKQGAGRGNQEKKNGNWERTNPMGGGRRQMRKKTEGKGKHGQKKRKGQKERSVSSMRTRGPPKKRKKVNDDKCKSTGEGFAYRQSKGRCFLGKRRSPRGAKENKTTGKKNRENAGTSRPRHRRRS